MSNLAHLHILGFDRSTVVPFKRAWKVQCSQCEALVINGIPSHERGCPLEVFECFECGNMGAARERGLCGDCVDI